MPLIRKDKEITKETEEGNSEEFDNKAMTLPQINNNRSKLRQSTLNETSKKRFKKHLAVTLRAFRRFAFEIKIRSEDDLYAFFTKYDTNQDGKISREEWLSILDDFKILSEYEKMLMINYTDENDMDDISILKFINIINSVKFEEDEFEELRKEIKLHKEKFHSKINFQRWFNNYSNNKKKWQYIADDLLGKILFNLQGNIVDNYNTDDTIEKVFFKLSYKTKTKTVPKKEFLSNIYDIVSKNGIQYDEEIEGKLVTLAFARTPKQWMIPLEQQHIVPYWDFIDFIVEYKIKTAIKFDPINKDNSKEQDPGNDDMKSKIIKGNIFQGKLPNKEFGKLIFVNKVDLNKNEDIRKIQNDLLGVFETDKKTHNELNDKNVPLFKSFIQNIAEFGYSGNKYEIQPEDYFEYYYRSEKMRSKTIFNNEQAALKYCETVYNSLKDGELYWDEEFGKQPADKDIANKIGKASIYYNLTPKNQVDSNLIDWYRTNEITRNPKFLDKSSVGSSEVVQGAIGDCWFLSALAAISTKDYLIIGEFDKTILESDTITDKQMVMLSTGVYPPLFHFYRKKGIYCLRFFKNFKWRYVVIDDRLPCMQVLMQNRRPKLWYGKSRNTNEFWVSLIEKAYAKWHGCYEALVSGCIEEAMMDLVGQMNARIPFSLLKQQRISDDVLWAIIKGYSKWSVTSLNEEEKLLKEQNVNSVIFERNNTILVGSVEAITKRQEICFEDEKLGLLFNHGYPIWNTIEIPKPKGVKRQISRLIRLKNVWGFKIWNGKWAKTSEEYEKNKENLVKELKLINEKTELNEPNTFIMCFSDFRKIMTKLLINIQLFPKHLGFYYEDRWDQSRKTSLPYTSWANFCNNPQYYFKLTKPVNIYACILQDDPRWIREPGNSFPFNEYWCETCLVVMKTETGKNRLSPQEIGDEFKDRMIITSPIRLHRENSFHTKIQPGEYILFPCNHTGDKEGRFKLLFYVEDTFKDSNYDQSNFIEKLTNSYFERLPYEKDEEENLPKPKWIESNSFEQIEKTKDNKEQLIKYQLQMALNLKKEEENKDSELAKSPNSNTINPKIMSGPRRRVTKKLSRKSLDSSDHTSGNK